MDVKLNRSEFSLPLKLPGECLTKILRVVYLEKENSQFTGNFKKLKTAVINEWYKTIEIVIFSPQGIERSLVFRSHCFQYPLELICACLL